MSEQNMASGGGFVTFTCASCRQEIEAPQGLAGQSVECPACGARLVVTSSGQAVSADAMKSRTIRIELSDL